MQTLQGQSALYKNLLSSSKPCENTPGVRIRVLLPHVLASAFGLELDSDTTKQTSIGAFRTHIKHTFIYLTPLLTAWLLFTAATVSDNGVRDGLISGAWARASSNATPGPFPDQYNVETGDILGGSAG